jgi:SOS-response transcriptional repressor LexA
MQQTSERSQEKVDKRRNPQRTVDLLAYLDSYFLENMRPPTIREIAAAIGTPSTSVASYYLANLVRSGQVIKMPGFRGPVSVVMRDRLLDMKAEIEEMP